MDTEADDGSKKVKSHKPRERENKIGGSWSLVVLRVPSNKKPSKERPMSEKVSDGIERPSHQEKWILH